MIYNDLVVPGKLVIRADPYITPSEDDVQLRLTYEGLLLGASRENPRAKHKHEIRKRFHKQLKRFWEVHPLLRSWAVKTHSTNEADHYKATAGFLAEQFARNGYNFVPLVLEAASLSCSISILMLRPDLPGSIIRSGDLDNRLKTLFDALRIPVSLEELGGYTTPDDSEVPFFCLLEDDKLITHASMETDTLLEPTGDKPNDNDCRLIIKVDLKPSHGLLDGLTQIYS